MPENQPYNAGTSTRGKDNTVARKKIPPMEGQESFGKRLARLRKAAGFSQYDLADESSISQRMIAYYETTHSHPPLSQFPKIALALGVSVDQLLGLQKTAKAKTRDSRLWRRFNQVEKLPPDQRKKIVDILDAFLKAGKS